MVSVTVVVGVGSIGRRGQGLLGVLGSCCAYVITFECVVCGVVALGFAESLLVI